MGHEDVQKWDKYKSRLHRNSTYKGDARAYLKGKGIYDDSAQIKRALQNRVKQLASKSKMSVSAYRDKYHKTWGTAQSSYDSIADRYKLSNDYTWTITGGQKLTNFGTEGGEASKPYEHRAHHMIPVEVFSDKKWIDPVNQQEIATFLDVILQADYDINNEKNIVYLPQYYTPSGFWMSKIHNLPNHGLGHSPTYNDMAISKCDELREIIQEMACCSCDDPARVNMLPRIKKKFEQIETQLWKYLVGRGANVTIA